MSFGTMLFNLVIGPLKLLFELIFSLVNRFGSPGISIAALSLCMNFLVLPLYLRADAIQEEERRTEARLAPGVEHIRKMFRGDQRFMTLQTYYRQNHYSQAHALKGLLPLLLEIPFFIAAYQFLSGLDLLKNASFGPIRDLGSPDALLAIGGLSINVLPVLMTIINLISSEIYTHGAPLKSKIQLYVMALVFLAFLYDSPAGLTMYWTLNNLFSLGKNLVMKAVGEPREKSARKAPAFLNGTPEPGLFFTAAGLIALLTGGLIPSAVIASSPSEFLDAGALLHPFWYIVNSLLLASGAFVLWLGIFYLMGSPRMKKGLEAGIWTLAGVMTLNYTVFHTDLGILSSVLQFETIPVFSMRDKLLNLGAVLAAAAVFLAVGIRWQKPARGACLAGLLAVTVMTGLNCVQMQPVIQTAVEAFRTGEQDTLRIPLSRKGKNVVVLMLDRAISSYVPAVFAEKPEVAAQFDGFTWYPNTLSHGGSTNFGVPGIFGGYEYTPWEMNQRKDEPLPAKHDEALLMMPTLFSRQDYTVTVIDPPYAGSYAFIPDLSIYRGLENVHAYRAAGSFSQGGSAEEKQRLRFRNFFSYALCETSPKIIYGTLYNCGFYNDTKMVLTMQVREGTSVATGMDADYLMNCAVLAALPEMTEIREEDGNTLLLMVNDITHVPQLLQTPDYVSQYHVNNTEYDREHEDRFSAGPVPFRVTTEDQMTHYHVNMAALIQVGKWLDGLRESGVYDNTRIILVSDHGRSLGLLPDAVLDGEVDLLGLNAFLMVKDFDSSGPLRTDRTFMTNADVPALASEGLLDHPRNPFTGKEIGGLHAGEEAQKVTMSSDWNTGTNNGNTFSRAKWYEAAGEVLNPAAWTYLGEY